MKKDDRQRKLFASAIANIKMDKLGISIDLLDEILRVDPDEKLALLARGAVYLKLGNAKNAKSDFSRVLEIDAAHSKALLLRGLAQEVEGSNSDALNDFDRAIDIDPECGTAYLSRATLLSKMGLDVEAEKDIKTAALLTDVNVDRFAENGNIWRSHKLRFEDILELNTY